MKLFLKIWSYVSNPIFVPSLVSIWYFNYTFYNDPDSVQIKLYLIVILTAAIPLLLYTVLKILGIVSSIHLPITKERIWPLLIYSILLIILLRGGFKDGTHISLYQFFLGVLLSTFVALLLSLMQFKISLHLIAAGGVLGFIMMLSIVKGIDLLVPISLIGIASGLTATSRLSMNAHNPQELIFGFILGLISQILVTSYLII